MLRHGWFSKKAADRGDIVQLYAHPHTGAPVQVTWVTTTDQKPQDDFYDDLEYQGPVGSYLKTQHGSQTSRSTSD